MSDLFQAYDRAATLLDAQTLDAHARALEHADEHAAALLAEGAEHAEALEAVELFGENA